MVKLTEEFYDLFSAHGVTYYFITDAGYARSVKCVVTLKSQ